MLKRFVLLGGLFVALSGIFPALPVGIPEASAAADIVPCGDAGQGPCTLCHLVVGGKRLLDWGFAIMTFVAMAVLVAMGILYIVSAGDEHLISTAKNGIKAALFGFAIMLAAWLIVNVLMWLFVRGQLGQDGSVMPNIGVGSSWWQFQCSTTPRMIGGGGAAPGGGGAPAGGGTTPATGGGFAGSGECQPVTNSTANPCSVSNMQNTCFANNAETWSAICQAESGGNASIPSGVDVCADGNPASFGLFQINITANPVGNLDCPSAFSGGAYTASNHSCTVTNQALYNQCVAAATDPQQNIQTACGLAGSNATNTGPWGAARRCGIPRQL